MLTWQRMPDSGAYDWWAWAEAMGSIFMVRVDLGSNPEEGLRKMADEVV